MSALRFDFQRMCIREEISRSDDSEILNVGANTDPGNFKSVFGDRIKNVDFIEFDVVLGQQVSTDYNFDATGEWPLADSCAGLVVFGDVLEHVEEAGARTMLSEARRVAERLCITVPNDPRLGPGWLQDGSRLPEAEWVTEPGSYHVQQVTEEKLRGWLEDAGWDVEDWQEVDYGFSQVGYFVKATRK